VKYKINRGQEFVVGGYTPGNPFDALIVGVYDGAKLNFVAKVRAGFMPHVRRELYQRLRELETPVCPFVNLPEKRRTMWALTADEMKSCRWLTPKLIYRPAFRILISANGACNECPSAVLVLFCASSIERN
jgi:hypothetical protein